MSNKINNIKKIMFFKNISSVKLAEKIGMPRQLLSYIINERALPLRDDALKISKILKTKPNRIWNKNDYFIKELESDFKPSNSRNSKTIWQISFRADASCRNAVLTKSNLNKLGYRSIQDWGTQKLQEFMNELEEKENAKK